MLPRSELFPPLSRRNAVLFGGLGVECRVEWVETSTRERKCAHCASCRKDTNTITAQNSLFMMARFVFYVQHFSLSRLEIPLHFPQDTLGRASRLCLFSPEKISLALARFPEAFPLRVRNLLWHFRFSCAEFSMANLYLMLEGIGKQDCSRSLSTYRRHFKRSQASTQKPPLLACLDLLYNEHLWGSF